MARQLKLIPLTLLLLLVGQDAAHAQSSDDNAKRIGEIARQLEATQRELSLTRAQLQAVTGWPGAAQTTEGQPMPEVTSPTGRTSSRWETGSVVQAASISACDSCPDCGDVICGGMLESCACGSDQFAWRKGEFQIVPFGAITGEMIGSNISPQLRGSPLYLLPGPAPNIDDSRFTSSAQQSTVGLGITGPKVCGYESGGVIAVNFFGEQPIQNNPGLFFMLAYAELKDESWRLWVGQDGDAIGRQNTNSPAWSSHKMQGNFGQIRPGFRAERYFQISNDLSSSLYFGLTQQAVNDFIAVPGVAGIDNGLPNFEARWEVAMGSLANGQRSALFAIGGVVGETRAVDDLALSASNVSTTWAVIPELRFEGERFGFQGETFVGQAMGTYNGAIGQSLNPNDGDPIYSVGGFGEFFWKMSPCFTASIGAGVDDPRDRDLGTISDSVGQRARNESGWVNFIWNLSDAWETRFEVSYLETTYIAPSNDGASMLYHGLVRYSF